jgi:flavin reductase ActVB
MEANIGNVVVDRDSFLAAMARFPAGVTIVTTVDELGKPRGFTASAFCSLSLEPPMVLVCLDSGADCHPAFLGAPRFAANILRPQHEPLALRFATKGANKFVGGEFQPGPGGIPVMPEALASVICAVQDRIPAGDHTILIGRVEEAAVGEGMPAVFFNRRFWRLKEARPFVKKASGAREVNVRE